MDSSVDEHGSSAKGAMPANNDFENANATNPTLTAMFAVNQRDGSAQT
jgi:hypothetical protein